MIFGEPGYILWALVLIDFVSIAAQESVTSLSVRLIGAGL
jgi:hypothetical protein